MADYAIVIGVRDYPTGLTSMFGTLTSPVKDAVKAARFLREVVGVEGKNIWTFLHPKDAPEAKELTPGEFPNGVNDATFVDLLAFLKCSDQNAVAQVGLASKIERPEPGKSAGRLFLFFSGHGVAVPISGGTYHDAIVPPDFGAPGPRMIACDWVVRNLKTLPIAQQLILFDCCRNEFRTDEIQRLEFDPRPADGVSQNVVYSTGPSYRAADVDTFLEALIERVKPDSPAGEFEPGGVAIHLDRLYSELESLFLKRMKDKKLGEMSADKSYQKPTYDCLIGGPCDGRMLVAKFTARAVNGPPTPAPSKVELLFRIKPDQALVGAELVISEPGNQPLKMQHLDIVAQPLSLRLPRGIYALTLTSDGYSTWGETADLRPAGVTGPLSFDIALEETGGAAAFAPEFVNPRGNGTLVVETADRLQPIVVRDRMNAVVHNEARHLPASGGGASFVIEGLPPDIYKVELHAADRVLGNDVVALGSDGRAVARLDAGDPGEPDSRLARSVRQAGEFGDRPVYQVRPEPRSVQEDAWGEPPSLTAASTALSSYLAAASNHVNRGGPSFRPVPPTPPAGLLPRALVPEGLDDGDRPRGGGAIDPGPRGAVGDRLLSLGLRPHATTGPGGKAATVSVLLGVEDPVPAAARRRADQYRLRVWPLGDPAPGESSRFELSGKIDGLAGFTAGVDPGPHVLSLEEPGLPPLVFALAVLKDSRTELVLTVRPRVGLKVLHYVFGNEPASVPGSETLNRIVQLEQFFDKGKAALAGRAVPLLLKDGIPEPISGCLAASLVLGKDPGWLAGVAAGMVGGFGGLADSHVIEAARIEAAGTGGSGPESAAGKSYAKALERGLPVTRVWLDRLAAGIARHKLEGEPARRALSAYRARVSDLPWTAWATKAVVPGRVVSFD